jgi:hypothetical protein
MNKLTVEIEMPDEISIRLNNIGYSIEQSKEIFARFLYDIMFDGYSHFWNQFDIWIEDEGMRGSLPDNLKLY